MAPIRLFGKAIDEKFGRELEEDKGEASIPLGLIQKTARGQTTDEI